MMPAGVTWKSYLSFTSAAMLCMMFGAQLVHIVYRPLDDLPELVEQEKQKVLSTRSDKKGS